MVVEAKREVEFEHLGETESKLRIVWNGLSSFFGAIAQGAESRDVEDSCYTEDGMQALNAGLHRSLAHPTPLP